MLTQPWLKITALLYNMPFPSCIKKLLLASFKSITFQRGVLFKNGFEESDKKVTCRNGGFTFSGKEKKSNTVVKNV